MKILFVNNFFSSYGGAEKLMLNQAKLLSKNGHSVEFFATDREPFANAEYDYKKYFTRYTDYKRLGSFESIKVLPKILYNIESECALMNLITRVKPDIVHCHNIYYHLTPSVITACKRLKVPVVMTLHDPRLMCPGGTMMLKSETYCNGEHCIKGNPLFAMLYRCRNSSLAQSIVSTLEYTINKVSGIYDYVSLFICPSRAIYNLAQSSGIEQNRLAVLNNFIADELIKPSPVYSNKGYFLYAGRLAREKGVHYLIEAAKFLPKNIEFHIVGSGPEEESLKQTASPNIKFSGYLESEELKKEYNGCIATILPCNWFETFGLTIAESFAYGKPVIASNIGAIPELVSHGIDGFLFEPGNAQQLSHYVYKLYTELELAALMGKSARHKAKRLFGPDLHYKDLVKIYKSVNCALN